MVEGMSPPYSNTGVQNTSLESAIALVDWVSATFTLQKTWQEIAAILKLKEHEFREMKNGLNGYKKQVKRGEIVILYDGAADMGVHLMMSGQACRQYEQENKLTWSELFAEVLRKPTYEIERGQELASSGEHGEGGHFTRLDLAIDDYKKIFTPEQIVKKLEGGLTSSRFKSFRYMKAGEIVTGKTKGLTVYFGSDASDISIRIYDKLEERRQAGKEIAEGVTSWCRTEVQMRDERADMAAEQIIKSGSGGIEVGVIVSGILANYLTFYKRKGTDSNKSRWEKWDAWQRFLCNAAKLKLTVKAPDRTIDSRRAWIDRQTSKTLATLLLAYDNNTDFIIDAAMRGMELLEEKEFNEIEAYKRHNEEMAELNQDTEEEREAWRIIKRQTQHKALLEQLNNTKQGNFSDFNEYAEYRAGLEKLLNELELKELDLSYISF